jgi:hypothetical protein
MLEFHSFLWLNGISLQYIYYIFFIHSSIDEHRGCSHILAIVNRPAIKMRVPMPAQHTGFNPFGYICSNGIAGSYGSPGFCFVLFLRHLHTVFHNGHTKLHPSIKVPLLLHPCQHLFFRGFSFCFDNSHSNWDKVLSHGGFDFIPYIQMASSHHQWLLKSSADVPNVPHSDLSCEC